MFFLYLECGGTQANGITHEGGVAADRMIEFFLYYRLMFG